MKRVLLGLVLGVLVGGVVAWSFLQHREPEKKEAKNEEHKEEAHVQHGTNGETFLRFDQQSQARMGLKVAALEAAQLAPEVKVFGRVLDPAPLAIGLSEIALAKATLAGTQKEYDRLKLLFGQNQNVSARALETAEGVLARDQVALQAARTRLAAAWGPAIAGMTDIEELSRDAVAQKLAIVRLDLPLGEDIKGEPVGARIAQLSSRNHPVEAKLLSATVTADPQNQSAGYLFTVPGALAANASIIGWLSLSGEKEQGSIIPREALLRHHGEAMLYVQTGPDTFEGKEVELEHPLEKGWFSAGLKPGTKVVVSGAQQLLSEQFKGEAEGE